MGMGNRKARASSRAPLVSSISTTVSHNLGHSDDRVATPEETIGRKRTILNIVDMGLQQFGENLANGNVSLSSTLDLERLTKLMLLVSGEPDSISGEAADTEVTDTTSASSAAVLDPDDPDVARVFDKLYRQLNETNDEQAV